MPRIETAHQQGRDPSVVTAAAYLPASPSSSSSSTGRRRSSNREGAIGRINRSFIPNEVFDDPVVDEEGASVENQHSVSSDYHSLGDDGTRYLSNRRPSSSSYQSSAGSTSGKTRRPSNTSSGPRSSSRNKILASSAQSLESSTLTSSPAHDYRIRSNSGNRDRPDATFGNLAASPMSVNARLPSSSRQYTRTNESSSSISTAPGYDVGAERKDRLATTLGAVRTQKLESTTKASITPQAPTYSRTNTSSSKLSYESQPASPKDGAKVDKLEDDTKKQSLRSRLFGLRKLPKDAGEDNSDAISLASTSVSTDYGKEARASLTPPKASPVRMKTERNTSRPVVPTLPNDLLTPSSAAASSASAVRPAMDRVPSKASEVSGETHSSWITSLSNVSPPAMPEYASLRVSPVSMSRGNSGETSPARPESRMSPLLRTTSWPASAERKGSFVSVQGGSGKGYRFENAAASQTRTSPTTSPIPTSPIRIPKATSSAVDIPSQTLQVSSIPTETPSSSAPAFLKIDPSPNQTPPPADRREKSRAMISKYGQPSPGEVDATEAGRRLRAHMRSDSSGSTRSVQSIRNSNVPRPLKLESGSKRRSWRNSSSMSMPWQDGEMETMLEPKRDTKRSATVTGIIPTQKSTSTINPPTPQRLPSSLSTSSLHTSTRAAATSTSPPVSGSGRHGSFGSPPSPVMPRSSSLHGHGRNSVDVLSRTSSHTNASFTSLGSPREAPEEHTQGDTGSREKSMPRTVSDASLPVSGSVKAILARLAELGVDDTVAESKGDLATFSSVDTVPDIPSRDSDLDQTILAGSPRQAVRRSQQFLPGDEPKRPVKNPLRKISATTVNSLVSSPTTNVPPSPVKQGPDPETRSASTVASASSRYSERSDDRIIRSIGQSPPRHSLDDVAHLRNLADNHFQAISQSRSREGITNEVIMQPVPQSAKRLVDVAGSHEGVDRPLPNDSTHSLMTLQENFEGSVPNASTTSIATEEYGDRQSPSQTTKKTKVPALATAFTRAGPSAGSRVVSMTDQGLEDETESISSKKKSKKWPFHTKDSPEVAEVERRVPSMGSKMANSLRGRKSEPQNMSRPLIRRVYDEARVDDSGEDEPLRVVSADTTVLHSPITPTAGFRYERRGTEISLFSEDSGPTTPVLTQEGLTPEVKKIVHRRNVIRELVETEKSYSSDLAVVRDIYLARAKSVVGLSLASSLQTPLSGHGTPTGTPTSLSHHSSKPSPLNSVHRNTQRMASSELKPPPSSPGGPTASPSSMASSSEPSNRSSMYTVSSQTSQASDSSFSFNASSAPPLPATPPNLTSPNSTSSGNTLHAPSPSTTSTFSVARNSAGKPKMHVSTNSLPLNNSTSVQTPSDIGFTITDLRVMFAHLEACCAFSEDMSSVLAGCMGTFARSKRLDTADVTVEMDREDDRLGEMFLQLMPRIRKVYINYCSKHEAGMLRLQEVLAASPKASAIFKESTELARKHTNAWDLASLLIKPVQRVLKYPLLIQQILNSTAKSHPDYSRLSLAFDQIQSVADEINHVKKRRDLAETLITGRIKEARSVMGSTSTIKGKRKLEGSTDDGLLMPVGAEEAAMEEYVVLYKEFQALADYVARFPSQCTTYTRSLRDSHESQISVMRAMRRTYRLLVEEVGADGVLRTTKENKEAVKAEERLASKYTKLLQTLLAESWRQFDRSVRLNILPRVVRIAELFEAPQTVMAKRDERQGDYQRYRLNLLAGRQSDRKTLESVNGFIALNAQLVDELPLFLQGVRTLLEVSVHFLSQFQAKHFQEIRDQTLSFWRDVAKKTDEVEVNENGMLSMRPINPVKVFWNRHSVSAAWIDSLSIVRRNVGMIVEDGDASTSSSSTTPAMTSTARMASGSHVAEISETKMDNSSALSTKPSNGSVDVQDEKGIKSNSNSNSEHNHSSGSLPQKTPSARRPTLVGNLMRTISGNFNKDQDGEIVPPLPSGAVAGGTRTPSQASARFSTAPMLPNLAFKDKEGESGYFVQSGPVPFLDTKEKEQTKQPYNDASPPNETTSRSISSYEEAASRSSVHTRNNSVMSSISVQANEAKQAFPGEHTGEAPRRQRMNVLYVCVAIADSQPGIQDRSHLGWPFIAFVKGDILRVLSSSDSGPAPLLFGRIDRSGELGWAEKRCF